MNLGKELFSYTTKHLGINTLVAEDVMAHIVSTTPNVIEERKMNASVISVFDRLMLDRVIFLGTGIYDDIANIIQAQLLFLDSVDGKKDINMYINSGGGSVYAGLGIYDTMNMVSSNVSTMNTGIAASMAAVLLASGEKGKRYGLKHSRYMIHQPLGSTGSHTQASDIKIYYDEMEEIKTDLYTILSETSGNSYEDIEKWCDRDNWMRASRAKELGFIDAIVEKS